MKYYDNTHNVYEPYQSYVRTLLNPYSPMSRFVITIHYPKSPNYNDEDKNKVVIPELSINDILVVMPQLENELKEYGYVSAMYDLYYDIAKEVIDYSIVGKPSIYKYIMSLYIAHNLYLNIRAFKDEANLVSMNDEVTEKNYFVNDMVKLKESGDISSFSTTIYGQRFIETYSRYVSWEMRGGLKRKRGNENVNRR